MSVLPTVGGNLRPRIEAEAALPTRFGRFRIVSFSHLCDGREHVAIVRGSVRGAHHTPVRMHSECLTGDAFASLRCDCREQLELSLERLASREAGVVLYMRQEGRGIGLGNKVRAYQLQDCGLDTVDANRALGFRDDERDYAAAAEMLGCLGIPSVDLMTNNPDKIAQLTRYGVQVASRVPHQVPPTTHNRAYLETKQRRSGHMLNLAASDGV
ncbi:MAG: GTP cyclohydrolase II [Myxococcota bacterium]